MLDKICSSTGSNGSGSLSLIQLVYIRQIRNILFTNYVDPDCFNVAVRVLASHPSNLCRDQLVHLMDLKFCTMSKFARDAGCREMLDVEQLAQLFRSWPGCIDEYHISDCDTIYLPYEIYGLYMLFVFNLQKKIVYILNPLPIQSWREHIFKSMEIGKNLNLALKVANLGWNDDICKCECKVSDVLPKNYHGYEVSHSNTILSHLFQRTM